MPLQPGDSFGRYDVTGYLGRGGMGVVLAAVHRDLDRPVALKVLAPHLADDAGYRTRFLREAKALARLDSPYVVRVFDAGEEEGALFIATELVRDGDLNELLRHRGALPAADAVSIVRDLALGLGAAHDVGILHRDIKPSNVLVAHRPDGGLRPVLCDFGIAAVADLEQLATTGAIGTPGYMAPERHQGADASIASDIYALGCLLWATLTARAPYEGATGQVLLGHLQGPVPQLSGTTRAERALNEVLAVAMAKDPADRFRTTAELVAALDAVPLGPLERTLLAPPPPPLPPARRSRRAPVVAGLLVLVLAGACAAWLLTRPDHGPAVGPAAADPSTTRTDPDPLVVVFPTATGCSVRVPKPTRVRTRWCHDDSSSVHYTQWADADVMDRNYSSQVLTRVTGVGEGLNAAWVELTKAEGEEWETKLAVWYADERAPYSVTIYADTQAAARQVLRDLDLRPVEEVVAVPRG